VSRIALTMPVLGFDQPSGRIAGWLRQVGERVERGDAVAEIETEKVTVEMEATAAGTLVEVLAETGAEVAVGETIAWLDDSA